MGSSSSQTTQQSSTQPWAAAMPDVSSLLGKLGGLIPGSTSLSPATSGAIDQLTAAGQAGNPYAGAIGNVANDLFTGAGATSQNPALQSNLQQLQSSLAPYAAPGYSTLNSPAVQAALQQVGSDVTNQVNGEFAAAGRSGSGMNQQTLARGIAQGEAPIIMNQANQDAATNQAAINALYGAGNTTAGAIAGNNQQGVANQNAGINAASAASAAQSWGPQQVLQAQQLAQSIPAQNLGLLAQIGIPLAELGTTGTTQSNTTSNPSMLSQLTSLGGLFSAPANGTSAIQGLSNFGGQALSGLGSLLPFLGL